MNTFPYAKMVALTMLYPDGLFTASVDGERVHALGRYFVETSSDAVVTDFRRLS